METLQSWAALGNELNRKCTEYATSSFSLRASLGRIRGDPLGTARDRGVAAQHHRRPRRRHGLLRHRLLRQRGSDAEPRPPGGRGRALHAVLQHAAVQPDTRAALLTGLYPQQAGMGWLDNKVEPKSRGFHGRLLPRCVTIAEVLGEAGYFTAMTGKWHLGQQNGTPPWKRGFMRSLNSQFGEVYFPKEARPARHRGALSQRPRDSQGLAGAGQGLVLHRSVHRLGPEVHRRGPRGEKAVLPLHRPGRGPFSRCGRRPT